MLGLKHVQIGGRKNVFDALQPSILPHVLFMHSLVIMRPTVTTHSIVIIHSVFVTHPIIIMRPIVITCHPCGCFSGISAEECCINL